MDVADSILKWLRPILPIGSATAVRAVATKGEILFAEEARLVWRAGNKRRLEFAAGRAAAHEGLLAIGYPPAPILAHSEGDPAWPAGVVGSISHTDRWALAVVSARDRLSGLGVDLESDAPLELDLAPAILRPEEFATSSDLVARGLDAAKLRFVAKESFLKAVFTITRRPLPFESLSIELHSAADSFRVRVAQEEVAAQMPRMADGWYCHVAGLICAVCPIPA